MSDAENFPEIQRNCLEKPAVWHLHGFIDRPKDIILAPDGYAKLYPIDGQIEAHYQAASWTLRHLLVARTFLFIGFGMEEAIEQQIRLDVLNAINQVESSKTAVDLAIKSRDFAKLALEAENKKYELGTSQIQFVLTAQNNLFLHVSGHLARLAGVKLAPDGPTPPWAWYDEDKKLPNGRLSPSMNSA